MENNGKEFPKELKILIIDNVVFHSTKEVKISNNSILFPIPRYYPELNLAEKVRQWMKDRIVMKIFDTLELLENKMEDLSIKNYQD